MEDDAYVVRIHAGCIAEIERVWRNAWQSPILTDEDGDRLVSADEGADIVTAMADMSLTWLVLHELMHIRLGHLELLGTAPLIETETEAEPLANEFPETAPRIFTPETKALIDAMVPEKDRSRLRRCLEMQADNGAAEIFIGPFVEEQWNKMRVDADCIFVVMSLMEVHNTQSSSTERTHPRTSTRFFMLLAQLFQYWLYAGSELRSDGKQSWIKTGTTPTVEAFDAYAETVLTPIVSDALAIAAQAKAKTFLDDLSEDGAIFSDIYDAQYAKDLANAKLRTAAAKEWRELLPLNEKLMSLMGLRG